MSNNEHEKKVNKKAVYIFGIAAMLVPFIIFTLVYFIGPYPILEKKDVLLYYGTIVGACFTGYITAAGLYFTLSQNAKSLAEQRQIDANARAEEKDRFNEDHRIKLINEKLNHYKDIYMIAAETLNKADDIHNKLDLSRYISTSNEGTKKLIEKDLLEDLQNLLLIKNKYAFMSEVYIPKEEKEILDLNIATQQLIIKINNITSSYRNDQSSAIISEYVQYYKDLIELYKKTCDQLTNLSKKLYLTI
jgi:hypothetical protein